MIPNKRNTNRKQDVLDLAWGKVPPSAEEVEEIVIGGLLLEPCFGKVADILKPEVFYKEHNRLIFEAISSAYANGGSTDMIAVISNLRKAGKLEEAGGVIGISQCMSKVASTALIVRDSHILYQLYLQREMIIGGMEVTNAAYINYDDALTKLKEINSILEGGIGDQEKTVASILDDIDNFEYKGIETSSGSPELDAVIKGINRQMIYVIAGRPGMGKTSIAISLFTKHMIDNGKKIAIWSLEMPDIQLVKWMLMSYDLEEQEVMEKKFYSDTNKVRYKRAQLIIKDNIRLIPAMKFETFAMKLRQMKLQGIDGVIIDYLQLITVGEKFKSENDKLEEIMRQLKDIAKQLDVFIILMSQLNREVESRPDKTPKLSDLRSSGAIEQSADVVMFPFRAEYYNPSGTYEEIGENVQGIMKVIVAKNKDGGLGNVYMRHTRNLKKFSDYTEDMTQAENNNF